MHCALCIVHYARQVAGVVVGVGGDNAARPSAGGEFSIRRVGIRRAEAVGVELVRQEAGGLVVVPPRGISRDAGGVSGQWPVVSGQLACGLVVAGGREGGEAAKGVVGVEDRVGRAPLGNYAVLGVVGGERG